MGSFPAAVYSHSKRQLHIYSEGTVQRSPQRPDRSGRRNVGAPDRLITWLPFKLSRPTTRLASISEGVTPDYGKLPEKFLRAWKSECLSTHSLYTAESFLRS